MRLRHNHRNGSTPRGKTAVLDAPPSPMNWRPQSAHDLIGQARDICVAQVAKARRLRDGRNAACKLSNVAGLEMLVINKSKVRLRLSCAHSARSE